jgi:hypothetical protein
MVVFAHIGEQSSPLGNTANISSTASKTVKKYTLLNHLQHVATDANLLSKRSGNPHRVRFCHAHKAYGSDAITIKLSGNDVHNPNGSFGGLQTCGSVWACPVCASRIAVEKGVEILKALEWAKQENLAPVMIALTARHHAGMQLAWFKDLFKGAWEMFSSGRRWRFFKKKYGIKHHIVNREVTRGDAGWHYHMHLLLFLDFGALKAAAADSLQADLEAFWMDCLEKYGLEGLPEIALKVSSHGNVGKNYLTKIGITISEKDGKLEYEMTSSETKSGRSIWDIARHSYYGDAESSRLYIEFVEAMQDTNFITFSHGLAELLENIELPAAESPADNAKEDFAEISPYWWTVVRRSGAMGRLLEQAIASRDIDHLREYLWSLQDELIDAGELADYHKHYRFRPHSSDDFAEGIRKIED